MRILQVRSNGFDLLQRIQKDAKAGYPRVMPLRERPIIAFSTSA